MGSEGRIATHEFRANPQYVFNHTRAKGLIKCLPPKRAAKAKLIRSIIFGQESTGSKSRDSNNEAVNMEDVQQTSSQVSSDIRYVCAICTKNEKYLCGNKNL
jgi:hypothetical protein